MKTFWCIHEDSLKILNKLMNKKCLMYSRRFIEDPDKVYEWKIFDVFTKVYKKLSPKTNFRKKLHFQIFYLSMRCLFSVKLPMNSVYQSVCFQSNCPQKVTTKVFVFSETLHKKGVPEYLFLVKLLMKSVYQRVWFRSNCLWKMSAKVFVFSETLHGKCLPKCLFSAKLSTKSFYESVCFQWNSPWQECTKVFVFSETVDNQSSLSL